MAFNTRGQNSPPSYLDGISVKISEKYKPPKKINVALSYSQILTLNKLIQDPYPNYDFSLEDSIKTRVNEWRKVRLTLAEERKQRLQILSQERNTKNNWSQQQQQQCENSGNNDANEVLTSKSNSDNDTITTSDISNNKDTEVSTTSSSSTSHFYTTESGVLIPMTIASSQSQQQQQQQNQQSNLNRPVYQIEHFNFSEFESDTSSPFDNMELKTINDLEELAEVLKRDSDINSSSPIINNTIIKNDQSTNVIENNYINSSSVVNTDNMYDNAYAYKPITNSKECHINGYYYNHHTPIYTSKVMYGHDAIASHIGNDLKHAQAHGSPIRSVTEIMKSLHEQFAANHITEKQLSDTASSSSKKNHHPQISVATKKSSEELLDNPYNNLSPDLQKMAVTISNMGFPLSRVARACQALDGNQKKIVEHLLAMSELLDLGFSEENVVNALLKCDNDRDKALDILIT